VPTFPPDDPDVLALTGVGVVAGGKDLIRDVDWRVRRGERWVVLGPNGAGKTTLLHVAAAYRLPTRGVARVLGSRLGRIDMRDLRRRIGYTSAELERRLDGRLLVRDAVLTGRDAMLTRWRPRDCPAATARAEALLEELGLSGLAGRLLASLSEGERRRVHLARSLVAEPELLLVDEPAAGLDIAGREHLVALLERLAASDLSAAVFVTHHLEEVPPGFTHALLLRDGRVVAQGPLDESLTAEPLSACFGLPLIVHREEGRYWARRAGSPVPG